MCNSKPSSAGTPLTSFYISFLFYVENEREAKITMTLFPVTPIFALLILP